MGWKQTTQQSDATKLREVVGRTFTVVDFEKKHSSKFNRDFVLIEALTPDGEDITLMGGAHLINFLEENRENLPGDVVVTKFDTDYGNPGYGLEPVEGYES